MGSPVWSRDGIIAVGNAYKDKVKLSFSHGPSPRQALHVGFGGKVWRAIDLSEDGRSARRPCLRVVQMTVSGSVFGRDRTETRRSHQRKSLRPTGVEPVTYGFEDHCSIQLSYGRILLETRTILIV